MIYKIIRGTAAGFCIKDAFLFFEMLTQNPHKIHTFL